MGLGTKTIEMARRAAGLGRRRRARATGVSVAAALLAAATGVFAPTDRVFAQTVSALSLSPEERCAAAALPADRFTAQEVSAWASICRNGFADLSANDDAGCAPLDDAPWPDSRILSQRFLDTILFEAPYRQARARESVQVRCARFPSLVDFSYREIQPALLIDNSRLDEGVSLFNTRARRLLSFRGNRVLGAVNGDRLDVADNLFLRDGARFAAPVTLTGARIGGNLEAGGSTYEAGLSVDDVTVDGAIFVNANAQITGDLRMVGAIIRRSVDVAGIRLNGQLNADSVRIEGSVFLNQGAVFDGPVILRAARIGSGVEAGGSTFNGELTLDRAEVGGALVFLGSTFNERVLLIGARIGSNALWGGAAFNGFGSFEDLTVDGVVYLRNGAAFARGASLRHGEITGGLQITDTQFLGPLTAEGLRVGRSVDIGAGAVFEDGLSFESADIADSLRLGGAAIGGLLDLENTRIGGALSLSEPQLGDPIFDETTRLSLRNTTVGAIRARPEAWALPDGTLAPSDLVGFEYARESALESSEMASMLTAPAATLIAWIESQRGPDGAAHDAAYNPQPYEQLQAALIRDGRLEKARAIKYARFEHYARAETTPELRRAGMVVLKYLAGYGVYPAIALGWFGGIVVLGFIVGFFSPGLVGRSGTEVFWYSFDNALPLLDLSDHHKQVRHQIGWVTTVFAAQRLFGLVLATALIGAVSLL